MLYELLWSLPLPESRQKWIVLVPSAAVDCVRGDPSSQLDPELELVGYPVGYLVDPSNLLQVMGGQ